MLIPTAIVLSMLAVGAVADRYSTPHTKSKLGSWIEQAKNFDWHNFIAQRSWSIYTKIFGEHAASKKFIIRSIIFYAFLSLASFLFLLFMFPSTYSSITSVWRFGSTVEQSWWVLCFALGGLLYVLANAQTLYFLEILKTAPNFFRFLLVAYADFLITASISLFGVPLILSIYTVGVASTNTSTLSLNIDFSRMERSLSDDTQERLGTRPDVSSDQAQARPSALTVRFTFSDSATDLEITNADYDEVSNMINRGHGGGIQRSGNAILYRSLTELLGVIARGRRYEDAVTSFDLPTTGTREEVYDLFCRGFASAATSDPQGVANFPRMEDVSASLLRACRGRTAIRINVPVRLNVGNLNFGRIYKTYLLLALSELTFSATSGFSSYLALSPYQVLEISDPFEVWNSRAAFFSPGVPGGAFDQVLGKAYLRQMGAGRVLLHKGLPAGTINFAIISTALFNVLVMSIFFLIFPLIRVAARVDFVRKYIEFERHPFSILTFLLSVWLMLITVVITSIWV